MENPEVIVSARDAFTEGFTMGSDIGVPAPFRIVCDTDGIH